MEDGNEKWNTKYCKKHTIIKNTPLRITIIINKKIDEYNHLIKFETRNKKIIVLENNLSKMIWTIDTTHIKDTPIIDTYSPQIINKRSELVRKNNININTSTKRN